MYAKSISALFYMFFTCVVLNPAINGVTLYLYVVIPVFDPGYCRFVAGTFRRWALPFSIAVMLSLLSAPSVAIRIMAIAICAGYLLYTFERRIDYLQPWVAINVAFAVLQFSLYYVDRSLASQFGPVNVAKVLWGNYATLANTNLHEIFYFARASGFSREAGFFSSLLVSSLFIYLLRAEKISKFVIIMYAIGFFVGFSKSSFVLFICLVFYPFRRFLRTLHPMIVLILFSGVCTGIGLYLAQHDFFDSRTFGHRFAGYVFFFDARLDDVIGGIDGRSALMHYKYLPYIRLIEEDIDPRGAFCAGLPASISEMGIFGAVLLLAVIAFAANDGFTMLLFLLLTLTVTLTTVTSFVVIAYVICYWPRFAAYSGHRVALARRRRSAPAWLPVHVREVH